MILREPLLLYFSLESSLVCFDADLLGLRCISLILFADCVCPVEWFAVHLSVQLDLGDFFKAVYLDHGRFPIPAHRIVRWGIQH